GSILHYVKWVAAQRDDHALLRYGHDQVLIPSSLSQSTSSAPTNDALRVPRPVGRRCRLAGHQAEALRRVFHHLRRAIGSLPADPGCPECAVPEPRGSVASVRDGSIL